MFRSMHDTEDDESGVLGPVIAGCRSSLTITVQQYIRAGAGFGVVVVPLRDQFSHRFKKIRIDVDGHTFPGHGRSLPRFLRRFIQRTENAVHGFVGRLVWWTRSVAWWRLKEPGGEAVTRCTS